MPDLKRIAHQMITTARAEGYAGRTLSRGLRLYLTYTAPYKDRPASFHLMVSRNHHSPSPTQIDLIRRDFALPPKANVYVAYHLAWTDDPSKGA